MLIPRIFKASSLKTLLSRFATKKFNLPDLGEKIKEGKIQKWYIQEGDKVEQFQKIADITSDKQFTELTASDTGTITKIFHKEDEICQVGSPLFEIDTQQEGQASLQSKQSQSTSKNTQKSTQNTQPKNEETINTHGNNKLIATPAVRSLLKQNNIDISQIQSTGKDGRILKEDVLRFIQNKNKPKSKTDEVKEAKQQIQYRPIVSGQNKKNVVEMNNYDRGMQKTMSISNQIPHLSYHEEYDLTKIMEFRESSKAMSKEKITYMSYFIKTFSMALTDFPKMNSWYNPESPFEYAIVDNHNITIAIDSPNGLAVPNIKNVQNLSIVQVQRQLNRLRKAAENGRIQRKDIEGGTISISNIGTVGGTYARPLILSPQVAIVALGKTRRVPRFESQTSTQVVARNIMSVSFSADHRVIDGGTVANFSNRWKQYLQNPSLIMLDLR